jgi:taurine dioxygenase
MSAVAAQGTQIPRLRPLAPQIGVEVQDIDLSQALDENSFRTIEQDWFDHGVLLFRNQQLSEDQQVDFARRFGELGKVLRGEQ